ncbi:MBL fold metallo-hydrolase [Caproiciproducens sp. CPB-2]|uniref:MBL fold metallo-hydrolase n=1 Tax=Caproiciproducens sp. CPB-2 TaxID=3030017 RepID=UPI0023DB6F9E|nr:MBL fold metallo-hydrolase [Caproiciproducens sp. CPB-2]MDF1496234.1 MBL fold metallo-hydrolase [Caproiciproducens sp. CPB-2]
MARICPLFSGSSGNSYYIGSSCAGILIDAGRTAKQLNNMLETCGIGIESVKAIFVTHEHIDHIRGLRVLASRKHIPVYTSSGTLNALEKMGCANGTFRADVIGEKGMECAGMFIRPFRTSHDCAESVGYRVQTHDGRSVGFSTDLGFLSDTVRDQLTGADLVVLESNHDVGMLKNGPYPYPLKRRILSDTGHLSNQACADELTNLAQKGTTRFILAHLSAENNTPELAFQTALCSLSVAGLKEGVDFQLSVAPRENNTGKGIIF